MEFEVLDLVLSRDGTKLAIVQGCPSYELIIYDLQEQCIVQGDNSKILIDQAEYLDFKFNPQNNNELAILNEGQLEIYTLESQYSAKEHEFSAEEQE